MSIYIEAIKHTDRNEAALAQKRDFSTASGWYPAKDDIIAKAITGTKKGLFAKRLPYL